MPACIKGGERAAGPLLSSSMPSVPTTFKTHALRGNDDRRPAPNVLHMSSAALLASRFVDSWPEHENQYRRRSTIIPFRLWTYVRAWSDPQVQVSYGIVKVWLELTINPVSRCSWNNCDRRDFSGHPTAISEWLKGPLAPTAPTDVRDTGRSLASGQEKWRR